MGKRYPNPLDDPPFASSSSDESEEVNFYSSSPEEDVPNPVEAVRKWRGEGSSNEVNSKRAKPGFQRVWSEEDEIALLKGMIDFKTDTCKTDGFYGSVRKGISFEVSKNQFMEKIRHLRKKYVGKVNKGVVEPSFSRAHQHKCFKLSNVIWGPGGVAEVMSNAESKKKKLDLFSSSSDWFESSFLVRSIESLGIESVKQKWSVVPMEAKNKIEEELNLLQANDLECQKIEEMFQAMKKESAFHKTNLLQQVISVINEAN